MKTSQNQNSVSSSFLSYFELAEKLQDVAQALLSISTAQTPDISSDLLPKVPTDRSDVRAFGTAEVNSVGADDVHSFGAGEVHSFNSGEVRSFFFPTPAIQLEKELLSKHRVNDFQGLLKEANLQLIGLVKLMQSVHKDTRFRGYIIASLG